MARRGQEEAGGQKQHPRERGQGAGHTATSKGSVSARRLTFFPSVLPEPESPVRSAALTPPVSHALLTCCSGARGYRSGEKRLVFWENKMVR